MKQEASLILPVEEDKVSTFEEVKNRLHALTIISLDWLTDEFWPYLSMFQNNEHHMEGWLYNHIILMLEALKEHPLYKGLSETDVSILEWTIIWSDLGKLDTYKDSPKKAWPDGSPQGTAFGHDKKSGEMFANANLSTPNFKAIYFLILEHMNAHKLEEMKDRSIVPDFLIPHVQGLEAWEWPEYGDLNLNHGESLSKKDYAWMKRGSCELLRIKQNCDEAGRISDHSFSS